MLPSKNKINNILEALGSIQKRTRSTIYLRLWAAFRKEQDQQYTRGSGQHSGEEQDQQYT
jgi:hypothetical protein